MWKKISILNLFLFLVCLTGKSQIDTFGIRFADSEMIRFPQAWQLDHGKKYVWGYAQGVGCMSMLELWKYTKDKKYYDYVLEWADYMVQEDGSIHNYKITDYNIDFINAGKILFDIFNTTGKDKYRMAMDTLLSQLDKHPQTSDSVFWHKKIYPHQIWLDGIYMAGPYIAQYGKEYNRPELIDKAIHEVIVTFRHTLDRNTGLLYHAYDESREQAWANKETGQSPHFWGRAIGWYFMAVLDILDFVPADHPQRGELIAIVQHLAEVLPRYQDSDGLWHQVIDMAGKEGNYPEASISSMCMYSFAKAVNKGYIDSTYIDVSRKTLYGLQSRLIEELPDGVLSMKQCCAVGGLGGKPYRDGSFDYYINEKIRDNDAKATAPFIMGGLELATYDNARKTKKLAFPGAAGFGRYASGGRGGEVYFVTNLNDDGPGSFRDAVSQPYRIVIFRTGGVIHLKTRVRVAPNITIAGQTAPGDGITIYGNGLSFASNTIVRHIRVHGSITMSKGSCTLVADNLRNTIFDHVSVQWGRWDNLHVKFASDVTFQYCMFGEAIHPQRFGALLERPDNLTIHHCLWINNYSRNPKAKANIQFYNNIIYNWGRSGFIGGHSKSSYYQDMIGNYFIAGPDSSEEYLSMFAPTDHVYFHNNYLDMNRNGVLDGQLIPPVEIEKAEGTLLSSPSNGTDYLSTLEEPQKAYEQVVRKAGAYLKRDVVDQRQIGHLLSLGKEGQLLQNEKETGGQPEGNPGVSPLDTDGDGIPDEWEVNNGLNPYDKSDGNTYTLSKDYTNIEVYINELLN